jgi:chromosome partitioning protein
MPLIITLAHQKGGVGKSTLATNLRGYFVAQGFKTALVDIDPQGSLSKLVQTFSTQDGRDPEHLITRNDFADYPALLAKLSPYDIAVIDTPPYLSAEIREVLGITHMVLVPCKASPLDYLAIGDTLALIREAQKTQPKLLGAVVLTMTIAGTEFTAQIRKQVAAENPDFPVLDAEIANRVAYMRSLIRANTVQGDDNRKAWSEIEALGHELISLAKRHYAKQNG